MQVLVVYDSVYGNTEEIAQAIGHAISGDVKLRRAGVGPSEIEGCELLIVGSPTQGGKPTAAVKAFLNGIPAGSLHNMAVAAFDTRVRPRNFGLRLLLGLVGYAAGRIAKQLRSKGGRLIAQPQGFIVQGTKGPLAAGEVERAEEWAHKLTEVRIPAA